MKQIQNLQQSLKQNSTQDPSPISGPALQITIGVLAFLLPTIMIVGAAILDNCQIVQNSISAYYHTVMRDVFVGILCGVGISMFAYKGYNPLDSKIATAAAVFAFGVAFFPTSVGEPSTDCLNTVIDTGIYGTFHFISAALLFSTLAFFSMVLFTIETKEIYKRRYRVFMGCGYVIIGCIVLIAVYSFFFKGMHKVLDQFRPVFYLEALALAAFSFSWLTKGNEFFSRKEKEQNL